MYAIKPLYSSNVITKRLVFDIFLYLQLAISLHHSVKFVTIIVNIFRLYQSTAAMAFGSADRTFERAPKYGYKIRLNDVAPWL
jgi:hypothetical protein